MATAGQDRAPNWRDRLRAVGLALGVGVATAATMIGVVYSILAVPFYTLAQVEPGRGLDRPVVRTGIFQIALPASLVIGVCCGVAVGVWYARGGRLPAGRRRSFSELSSP